LESFGKYQLIRKLATGGMAEVWLAQQEGMEGFAKLVVVKRILPHLVANREFVQMFLDEARVAARLNHPNIAQVFDLGHQGENYYLAMEYCHGSDLRRTQRQADALGQPFPLDLACRTLIGACEGLHYAHGARDPATGMALEIVHRDISPQNIMVTFDGGVKVVDFGIAKAADQVTETRSGVLKGKYAYMSPEQAEGKPLDPRSDVFALGVVLWELATGQRLFKRATEAATLTAVLKCQVARPSEVNPAVPPTFDRVCLKALEREVQDRTPSCRQLQVELEDFLVDQKWAASSVHLGEYMRFIFADRLAEEERQGGPFQLAGDPPQGPPPELEPFPQGDLHTPTHGSLPSHKSRERDLQARLEALDAEAEAAETALRRGGSPVLSETVSDPTPPSVYRGALGGPMTEEMMSSELPFGTRSDALFARMPPAPEQRSRAGLVVTALLAVAAVAAVIFTQWKERTPPRTVGPVAGPPALVGPLAPATIADGGVLAALPTAARPDAGSPPDAGATPDAGLAAIPVPKTPVTESTEFMPAAAPIPQTPRPDGGEIGPVAREPQPLSPPRPLADTDRRRKPPPRKPPPALRPSPPAKPGSVVISTGEMACEIFEGGRRVGSTPGVMEEVPAGEHVYSVRCEGLEPARVATEVLPGRTSTVANPFRNLTPSSSTKPGSGQ
jgi:serine/threonine protein kinase